MKFICKKHGIVEAEPNANLQVYCPKCLQENVPFVLKPEHLDEAKHDVMEACPLIHSDREVALIEAEDFVKAHLDEIDGMLEHQVIEWVYRNAPVSVVVEIVNLYRYMQGLEKMIKKLKEKKR